MNQEEEERKKTEAIQAAQLAEAENDEEAHSEDMVLRSLSFLNCYILIVN